MSKTKIYTKSGDKGESSLLGGSRVSKNNERLNLYGSVDELNSYIGVAISFLDDLDVLTDKIDELKFIQARLFDLGSNMACEKDKKEKFKLPQITDQHVLFLEKSIDKMDSVLPELKNFILPGGQSGASFLHVCRTVCRRLEREMVASMNYISETELQFINRLSDYFFVMSRYINKEFKIEETLWNSR